MTADVHRFVTVDVFTDRQFAGNPLAVFPDAAGIGEAHLQPLAAEMNLSETCFILPPQDAANHARLRIFHRTAEMPFAGHPTIGSAFVLACERFADAATLRLEVPAGVVVAEILRDDDGAAVGARIDAPQPLETFDDYLPADIAACLRLEEGDLVLTTHAAVRASTGVEFILFETTADALDRAAPAWDAFTRLAAGDTNHDRFSLFAYARLEGDGGACTPLRVEARMFAPLAGTWEDPGTGSASSILGALLLERSGKDEIHIANRQGARIGRPCRIDVRAWRDGDKVRASVAGHCVKIFEGHFAPLPLQEDE